MSIDAYEAVWDYSQFSGNERMVLMRLARHANEDGICYPAQAHLADKCRLSDREVRRCLRALREAGEIVDTGERIGKGVVVYRVEVLDKLRAAKAAKAAAETDAGEMEPEFELTCPDTDGPSEAEVAPATANDNVTGDRCERVTSGANADIEPAERVTSSTERVTSSALCPDHLVLLKGQGSTRDPTPRACARSAAFDHVVIELHQTLCELVSIDPDQTGEGLGDLRPLQALLSKGVKASAIERIVRERLEHKRRTKPTWRPPSWNYFRQAIEARQLPEGGGGPSNLSGLPAVYRAGSSLFFPAK